MRWWAAVAVGSVLALPAAAETIHVDGVFAAGARAASVLPTIAVGPFGGPDGEELADAIERRLAKLDADGVPHARLIPPSLRPDGLLTGRTNVQVVDSGYTEGRERCTERKDNKCTRRVTYSVACVRRTIALRAELRLVRPGGGRDPYAATKTRDDRSNWCEDGGVPGNVPAAVSSMIEAVAAEVRLDLAPHAERYTVRVQEKRDGLPDAAADRFREAVHLTKSDPAAACAAFAEVERMAPDHGPTMFNLALCGEAAGRYREAADRYTRARLLLPGAGGDISKGLERVGALAAGAQDVAALRRLPPVRGTGI